MGYCGCERPGRRANNAGPTALKVPRLLRPCFPSLVETDIIHENTELFYPLDEHADAFIVREVGLPSQVIIMTSLATYETIVEAGRNGAFDYLKKPFEDLEYLLTVVRRAAESSIRTRRGASVRARA